MQWVKIGSTFVNLDHVVYVKEVTEEGVTLAYLVQTTIDPDGQMVGVEDSKELLDAIRKDKDNE